MKAITTLVFLLANVGLGRTLSPEPAGHKFIAAGPGDSKSYHTYGSSVEAT